MKKVLRNIACALIIGSAMITTTSTDARLPKKTACAVLNKIIEDLYPNRQNIDNIKNAVIGIIYTDDGNRKIVNFVRNKNSNSQSSIDFVNVLKDLWGDNERFSSEEYLTAVRNIVTLLFPCYTGTFTAYKHNSGQSLGWWVLHSYNPTFCNSNEVSEKRIRVGNRQFGTSDPKKTLSDAMGKIDKDDLSFIFLLFGLEILDTPSQLSLAFDSTNFSDQNIEYDDDQYFMRPLPNSARDTAHSDCIETSLKHLLALFADRRKLPTDMQNYFDQHKNVNESSITSHEEWGNIVDRYAPRCNVTPNLWGLAKSLANVALASDIDKNLKTLIGTALVQSDTRDTNTKRFELKAYQKTIDEDRQQLLILLQFALSALAGCTTDKVFVDITTKEVERLNSIWPTELIEIRMEKKKVVLGVGGVDFKNSEEVPADGVHSEIIEIFNIEDQ